MSVLVLHTIPPDVVSPGRCASEFDVASAAHSIAAVVPPPGPGRAERPCVLDVNPNPELAPGSGLARAVEEAGWWWADFARQQIAWA